MEKISISIIIPAYNAEKTISETIMSILNQNYENKEIIIIDDGSTDNTEKICKNMSQEHDCIKYFKQQNKGVSSARNYGISLSTGKYLCFLDSDDLQSNNFLKKYHEKIIENEIASFLYSGFYVLNKNDKIVKRKSFFTDKNVLENYLLFRTRIHTSSFMVKKDFIEENNIHFNEELSWGEDVEFISKCIYYANADILFINDYLSIYNDDNISTRLSSSDYLKIDDDYKSLNQLYDFFKNKNEQVAKLIRNYRFPELLIYKLFSSYINDEYSYFLNMYEKYNHFLIRRKIKYFSDYKYFLLKIFTNNRYRKLKKIESFCE